MGQIATILGNPRVERACCRSALLVDLETRRGLSTLASIAATAPLTGCLATTLMIPGCFPGFGTDRATILGVVTGLLAASLVPSAFGILLGVFSRWTYEYLRREAESLRFEMANLQLFLYLYAGGAVSNERESG